MNEEERKAAAEFLNAYLKPWHDAVENPVKAQDTVLSTLLKGYAQTDYGRQHSALQIDTIGDYRRAFPVITYEDCKPIIQNVMAGDTRSLLNEEPIGWAITRGTTSDEPKFIPMTPTDLSMRVSAGRAVMNYAAVNEIYDIFEGVNLNLNFPSVVIRYPPRMRSMRWEEVNP